MAVSWKWHRDHPQLGLHPGVDVRGAAAVSCPHVQEAAHHLINLEKKNPSLRPTITTSLESEVEFISQYQEVKTDNNDGKITFVLTHSNKYILCMFPPDYSHGEVQQEKWMLWQEIEGMETLDTNAM